MCVCVRSKEVFSSTLAHVRRHTKIYGRYTCEHILTHTLRNQRAYTRMCSACECDAMTVLHARDSRRRAPAFRREHDADQQTFESHACRLRLLKYTYARTARTAGYLCVRACVCAYVTFHFYPSGTHAPHRIASHRTDLNVRIAPIEASMRLYTRVYTNSELLIVCGGNSPNSRLQLTTHIHTHTL